MKFSDEQKRSIRYRLRRYQNMLFFLQMCALRDAFHMQEYEATREFEEKLLIEFLEANPGVIEQVH